jgi:hypothetical protein
MSVFLTTINDGKETKRKIGFIHQPQSECVVTLPKVTKKHKVIYEEVRKARTGTCIISDVAEDGTKTTISEGTAVCQPEDNYEKHTARLISFSRALVDSDLADDEKGALLMAFVNRNGSVNYRELLEFGFYTYPEEMLKAMDEDIQIREAKKASDAVAYSEFTPGGKIVKLNE